MFASGLKGRKRTLKKRSRRVIQCEIYVADRVKTLTICGRDEIILAARGSANPQPQLCSHTDGAAEHGRKAKFN